MPAETEHQLELFWCPEGRGAGRTGEIPLRPCGGCLLFFPPLSLPLPVLCLDCIGAPFPLVNRGNWHKMGRGREGGRKEGPLRPSTEGQSSFLQLLGLQVSTIPPHFLPSGLGVYCPLVISPRVLHSEPSHMVPQTLPTPLSTVPLLNWPHISQFACAICFLWGP